MRIALACLGLLALAACGADGAPLRPAGSAGLSVGTDGVDLGAALGVTDGTFSVGVGL